MTGSHVLNACIFPFHMLKSIRINAIWHLCCLPCPPVALLMPRCHGERKATRKEHNMIKLKPGKAFPASDHVAVGFMVSYCHGQYTFLKWQWLQWQHIASAFANLNVKDKHICYKKWPKLHNCTKRKCARSGWQSTLISLLWWQPARQQTLFSECSITCGAERKSEGLACKSCLHKVMLPPHFFPFITVN